MALRLINISLTPLKPFLIASIWQTSGSSVAAHATHSLRIVSSCAVNTYNPYAACLSLFGLL